MPISLPNLDDYTYDDLIAEAQALIPTYAPAWTNFNPSDPGITLVELFAHLTELLLYRIIRVGDANLTTFLRLLNGPEWQLSSQTPAKINHAELERAVIETLAQLRCNDRAVTCADYEALAQRAAPDEVARARCSVSNSSPDLVYVVIAAQKSSSPNGLGLAAALRPSDDLLEKVQRYLEPRRLLTTRVQVVAPVIMEAGIHVTLALAPHAQAEKFVARLVSGSATAKELAEDLTNGQWSKALTAALPQSLQGSFQKTNADGELFVQPLEADHTWLITSGEQGYVIRYETSNSEQPANGSTDQAALYLYEEAETAVRIAAIERLAAFFDPWQGGADGQGWPWGRPIYAADVYQQLSALPAVLAVLPSRADDGQALPEVMLDATEVGAETLVIAPRSKMQLRVVAQNEWSSAPKRVASSGSQS